MKKVKWSDEFGDGDLYPMCPYCGEFAYEEDECVFCGKRYRWVEKRRKERSVKVGKYTVVQCGNNHIHIYKYERMVLHASCTKRMSKRRLRKQVKLYEMQTEKEDEKNG